MPMNEAVAIIPLSVMGLLVLALPFAFVISIVSIVCRQRTRRRELGYQFVMELLDRGVPSDEISEILSAWQQDRKLTERLIDERKSRRRDIVEKSPIEPGVRARKPIVSAPASLY